MGINKGTLAKEVNGTIEYIYPKTSADMVEYTTGVSVQNKISELISTINNINASQTNLILNATNGDNSAELVQLRKSAFGTTVYDTASAAVGAMIKKVAPVKFRLSYSFDSRDAIGAYIISKNAGAHTISKNDEIINYKTAVPLNNISGSSLVAKFYNKANNNLLFTKTVDISSDVSIRCNIYYTYHIYFTYAEFDSFKNLTIYPIFTFTPGNGDAVKTVNCKDIINQTQKDCKPIFDYSGINTT